MSLNNFLDRNGLNYLWSKVVSRISSSESSITAKIPIASDDLPKDLGPSSPGVSSKFSRSDHVHKVPDDIVSYTDAQTGVEETTKINADLLENHPASDFALKTNLETLQSKLQQKLNRLSDDPSSIISDPDLASIKNSYSEYQEKYTSFILGSSSSVGATFLGMKTNFGGYGIIITHNGMSYCSISRDGEWSFSGGIGMNS